jgi:chromosomal replication initiator protein
MTIRTESLRADQAAVQEILAGLQERIGPQRFNAWFKHGVDISLEEGHINVAVPNPFVGNWIESHYCGMIAETAERRTGRSRAVVVTIDPALSGKLRKGQLDRQAEIVEKATTGRSRPRWQAAPAPLRYRLADFVVGESNRLAYSAAVAMVKASPVPFNPLFVHGPCGVGKTHLLQGICNAASRTPAGGRPLAWRYLTAEQFTNDFLTSLRRKKVPDFRSRYRQLDLLAIDDVHFLAAKRATQDEFLHTFNAIHTAGRRVVMASDAHPRLVGELNEPLVSRFVAGMVVKIDAPDQPTRLEILRRRAEKMKLTVPGEVLEYIAVHIRRSARELEGTLVRLAALSALADGKVTLRLAAEALAEHLARTGSAITLGDIEAVVAAFFGITPADIHSSRRVRTVSVARMVAMFLARRHTRMSYPEIGRFMGKNHSSVVLAVQKMERMLAEGEELTWQTPAGRKSLPAEKLIEMLSGQVS